MRHDRTGITITFIRGRLVNFGIKTKLYIEECFYSELPIMKERFPKYKLINLGETKSRAFLLIVENSIVYSNKTILENQLVEANKSKWFTFLKEAIHEQQPRKTNQRTRIHSRISK